MDLRPEPVEGRGNGEVADGQVEGEAITWIWTGGEGDGAPEKLGQSGGGLAELGGLDGCGFGRRRDRWGEVA